MTFERPELLALAPLVVLVVSLAVTAQWRRGLRLADAFGGAGPSARLASRRLVAFPAARLASLLVAGVALSVAAAGPERPEPPPVTERPIDLVVVVDVSLSMSAGDVGVSRAARAADVLAGVMDALPGDRVGVEVFADWPYTLVPVTHDLDVIRFFEGTIVPEAVSDRDQGTRMGAALTHARAALERRRRPEAEPVILLLSDGEGFSEAETALDSVAVATGGGVRLWTGGIGTSGGAPLMRPDAPDQPVLDERGDPVSSRLDEALLRRMAEAGGGRYFDVSGEDGLRAMLEDLAGAARPEAPPEQGPGLAFWLSLLALPLLLLEGTLDSDRLAGLRGAFRGAPGGALGRGSARAPGGALRGERRTGTGDRR